MTRQLVKAPETTKVCPCCGGTKLALIGTQHMKMCIDCPTNIVWVLTKGQAAIYGGVLDEQSTGSIRCNDAGTSNNSNIAA